MCYDGLMMKILLPLFFILFSSPLLAVETTLTTESRVATPYILSAEMWARPRSGQTVLNMPPIRSAVAQVLKRKNSYLLIRYPGGDEGSIWAEELQSWLIALGIEPVLIEIHPGSMPEQIELQIMTTVSVK